MARLRSLSLVPFIALAALAFGGVFVWIGVEAALGGAPLHGALIALFGALGVGLAVGLWRFARRLRAAERDHAHHESPTETR